MYNPQKTITCSSKGIIVNYLSKKQVSIFMPYKNSVIEDRKINQSVRKDFNAEQHKMYSLLIHGLKALTEEEIKDLSVKDKVLIQTNHIKVQKALNIWKHELSHNISSSFLEKMFPHSKLVRNVVKMVDCEDDFVNTCTFKQLGLDKFKIAEKLIELKFLPNDFFELK